MLVKNRQHVGEATVRVRRNPKLSTWEVHNGIVVVATGFPNGEAAYDWAKLRGYKVRDLPEMDRYTGFLRSAN